MATFSNTTQPTPFGIFDNDSHFQEEADGLVLYVKRLLGDDILSVELTSKQIWANFEEAVLEFSKQINSHQAESYMSNILGLSTGLNETFKRNDFGHYYYLNDNETADDIILDINGNNELRKNVQVLLIQDITDPRFRTKNQKARAQTKLLVLQNKMKTKIKAKPNHNKRRKVLHIFKL